MVVAAVGSSHPSARAGVYPPPPCTVSTVGSIRTVRFPDAGSYPTHALPFRPFKRFNCLAFLGHQPSNGEDGPPPKLTLELREIERPCHGPRVYDRVNLGFEDGVDRVHRACRRAHRRIRAHESAVEARPGGTTCPRCVRGREEVLVAKVGGGGTCRRRPRHVAECCG